MTSLSPIGDDLSKLGLNRDLTGASGGGAAGSDRSKVGKGAAGLGAEDFLALMVAQFKNQDPTKPVDNAQFIAQLASFGTVTGIDELNRSMQSLTASFASGQTVQAASLLGRDVLVNQPTGWLDAGAELRGAIDVPSGTQRVSVQIKDAAGQVVRTIDAGSLPAGLAKFAWDGRADGGAAAPAGRYTIEANALVAGKSEAATALVEARVESVTLGAPGQPVTLSLRGLADVAMTDVRQIS
jgi:flagellar basal-body rod modification protein FlgD